MTKEQKFKKEYAIELARIAQGDLLTAQTLANAKGPYRPENICFLVQQAIEKAVKAVLVHHLKPVPFTHSIEILLSRISSDLSVPTLSNLDLLSEYATVRRYEEGMAELTAEDLKAVLEAGEKMVHWALLQIKKR